jgi:exosortase
MALQSVAAYTIYDPYFGRNDEPLLFITIAAVLWIERTSIIASIQNDGNTKNQWYGLLLLCFGLLIFVMGSLFPVMVLEVWGLFIMASSLVLTFAPREYFRSAAFIGISGTVLVILGKIAPEALSSRLAVTVASLTAKIINATLFPIVANGVVLFFGPYSAEVAHACSGMNSIFSLLALSLIYLREGVQRKLWHIVLLILLVIPIAVVTNMLRVIILVLVTQYFGERYAQGIIHDFAGIIVFVFALLFLAFIDYLFSSISGLKVKSSGEKV